MILIDTNILLYAVNEDDPRCPAASRELESTVNSESPWAITWSIVYEFLRVSTHPRVFSSPLDSETAWGFMRELLGHPCGLMLTETTLHEEVFDQCLAESPRIHGNLLHDFHLAVLMREHGVSRILTEDRDFVMFPWVEVKRLSAFSGPHGGKPSTGSTSDP